MFEKKEDQKCITVQGVSRAGFGGRFFCKGLPCRTAINQRQPMRIAVLSDTHDRYPPSLPGRLGEADEIWHLGDVCAPQMLLAFERLGPPLCVVLGNCDSTSDWPLALDLEREGVRFHLIHIPPARAPKGAQVVLHGHTHVPRDETDRLGVRWLNPGCISRPNCGSAPSWAWLTVERGAVTRWELVRV